MIASYAEPTSLPSSQPMRIAALLGLTEAEGIDEVGLALRVADGLRASTADHLAKVLGRGDVIGPLVPEATLRRAKKQRKPLSKEMSERLYEVSRVVDIVSRAFHGDRAAVDRFLRSPHPLLAGRSPLALARASSAGADAVVNLLRRADAGVAL